ncbi:cupin domain-containing protein [Hydrocarboniphaga effusa]|jgi:predicted cupin superfamily sugar epimerase|uniref:cupin domain-containing protein n=1 Tax=Hydrocarboniphaga effusa TaxID=243629 RepID=UPI00313788C5
MNPAAADWIARLGLAPHPEGGWFARIHTDARLVDTPAGPRAVATSIHYLLDRRSPVGRFHRNRSDILHYLQSGGPVDYWLLEADGSVRRVTLGLAPNQQLFLHVPGGVWKASVLHEPADHALVSEVVTPGFDYTDHEFLTLETLHADYPRHAGSLAAFVRPG